MLNVQPFKHKGIAKSTVQTLSQIEGVESAEAYYSTDNVTQRNRTNIPLICRIMDKAIY